MYVDPGWYLKGNTFALRFGVVAEDAERFPDVHALLSASLEDTVTMCGSFRSFESAWVSLWWNPKPIISCLPISSGSSSVCAQSCHICRWKDCQQQYGSPKLLDFRTFIQQKTVFFLATANFPVHVTHLKTCTYEVWSSAALMMQQHQWDPQPFLLQGGFAIHRIRCRVWCQSQSAVFIFFREKPKTSHRLRKAIVRKLASFMEVADPSSQVRIFRHDNS